MEIQVVKKKASSLRELGRETVELPEVSTLRELLTEMVYYELDRAQKGKESPVLKEQEIASQSRLGRVSFGVSDHRDGYSGETPSSVHGNGRWPDGQEAVRVMLQDFEDGLFRVFLNGEEYLKLDDTLHMKGGDEVVFIRLVMLAGRMW